MLKTMVLHLLDEKASSISLILVCSSIVVIPTSSLPVVAASNRQSLLSLHFSIARAFRVELVKVALKTGAKSGE